MKSVYCVPCHGWYVWVGGPRPVCPFCHKPPPESPDPRVPYDLTFNDRAFLRSLRIQPDEPRVIEDDGA